MDILLQEQLKSLDNLQELTFNLGDKQYKWYFRYMTILEKFRIEQNATKLNTTINVDGSKIEKYEKHDYLIPIHTIIEKALDEDGKRMFSHTNREDIETISMLPAALASFIAYEMGRDIFGSMTIKGGKDE